ncbi:MAG: hypothetical protein A3E78_11855 [Alphaproteobacteria bacterium RIFCSPHIGHO2_12_FULL_63_12]|nr:MAG: hypothetical protein A3E78_11855 [Alphaproteobacteria bacterium RIFCSPHIGHO2_12_FULL_63_12]
MSRIAKILGRGAEGRLKQIACRVWPEYDDPDDSLSELRKYLSEQRGERAFLVVDAVLELGHKDVLRTELLRELEDISPSQMAEVLREGFKQLEMFGGKLIEFERELEKRGEVLPLRRKDGG